MFEEIILLANGHSVVITILYLALSTNKLTAGERTQVRVIWGIQTQKEWLGA